MNWVWLFLSLCPGSEILGATKDKALGERVSALEQERAHLQTSLSTLQEQCLKYTNQIRLLTSRNTKNNETIDTLQTELNQAKDENDLLRRKVIKAEFPPFAGLAPVKPVSPHINTLSLSSSGSGTAIGNNVTSPMSPLQSSVSKEPKENGNTVLESELAEIQAIADSRLEEIKQLNKDREKHIREITALVDELNYPPVERVQASPHYVRAQKEIQSLTILVEDKDSQVKSLRAELSRLNASRRSDIQSVENIEYNKRRVLEKQISELEARVSTLIGDRADLITKLDHQLASTPSRAYMEELKQLLASKDSDIKKSRDEVCSPV